MAELLGRHPPFVLTDNQKRRLASLFPRQEVYLSTPRTEDLSGSKYRAHGETQEVKKAQMDARDKANIARLRSTRPARNDASGLNIRRPDKHRLQKNINASIQQANTEYEFSLLDNARRRLDYLRRAKEAAGANYTGPPIIDFSEVIKQGLRGNRPLPRYMGLDSRILGVYNPRNASGDIIRDAIHVDPGKLTSSVVPFTRGAGSTSRKYLSVGELERPLEGKPIIEIEMHEIGHRVARDLINDKLFRKIHAESDGMLPFLYTEGESYGEDRTFIQGGLEWVPPNFRTKTPHSFKGEHEGYYKGDDTYSREHQMIRAATEGADPTKTPEARNLARRSHTPQAIRDAKEFNELVRRYAIEKRKIEMAEAAEKKRRELEEARERREKFMPGRARYDREAHWQDYKDSMKITLPPPPYDTSKSGLL